MLKFDISIPTKSLFLGQLGAGGQRLVFVTNRGVEAVVEAVRLFADVLAAGPKRFSREF